MGGVDVSGMGCGAPFRLCGEVYLRAAAPQRAGNRQAGAGIISKNQDLHNFPSARAGPREDSLARALFKGRKREPDPHTNRALARTSGTCFVHNRDALFNWGDVPQRWRAFARILVNSVRGRSPLPFSGSCILCEISKSCPRTSRSSILLRLTPEQYLGSRIGLSEVGRKHGI